MLISAISCIPNHSPLVTAMICCEDHLLWQWVPTILSKLKPGKMRCTLPILIINSLSSQDVFVIFFLPVCIGPTKKVRVSCNSTDPCLKPSTPKKSWRFTVKIGFSTNFYSTDRPCKFSKSYTKHTFFLLGHMVWCCKKIFINSKA